MAGKIVTERLRAEEAGGIARAAGLLSGGGIVAFPTETVYGLGADALNEQAVERIFAAKQRPLWDPLIVHVADLDMLARVASLTLEAGRMLEAFWPGPLTLLLPRTRAVPDSITAGRPLIGVRMPAHPVALDLIRCAGTPLAAPSANRFGHTSPTTAAHVLEDLDGRIDAVLDGGPTPVGVESTVLGPGEHAGDPMVIYRPGAVTVAMLERVCGSGGVRAYAAPSIRVLPEGMASPGIGLRHYAPRARLILVRGLAPSLESGGTAWVERVEALGGLGEKVGVMLPDGWSALNAGLVYRWGGWRDGEALGRRLFSGLRELDEGGATVIVCPVPEMDGIGVAIRDRLEKAARLK